MNPLQSRLAALRRRLRIVVTVRGVCLAVAALLAGLFLAGLCDTVIWCTRHLDTPSLLRAGFLAGTLTVTGAVVFWLLVRPLTRRMDDLSLALRVEEQYPKLNDALASTVQFLANNAEGRPAASPGLQQEAIQRALRQAQGCDFNKAVKPRGLVLSAAALVGMLTCVLLTLLLWQPGVDRLKLKWPAVTWTTPLVRVADPFGDHPWIGKTEIEVRYPAFLGIGQPLTVAGEVRGNVPKKAYLEFEDASMPLWEAEIEKKSDRAGSFLATNIKVPTNRREIRFRVRVENGVSPKEPGAWHTVALRRPPQLVSLGGKPSPQIVIRQPRYTGLPEFVTLQVGTGNLDVVAGSRVKLRAAADVPLARAWIEYRPLVPGARDALILAGLGGRQPLEGVAVNVLAHSAWGRVFGVLSKSGEEFTVDFVPALTGAYILTIQDTSGLSKSYEFDLNVKADPVPTVNLLRPAVSQSVLANAEITLQIQAMDDIYALRTVFLEYRRKNKQGMWVDAEPKRLTFYDHARTEFGIPMAIKAVAGLQLTVPTQLLSLRPKRLTITQRWSLRGLAVEGETLVIQAGAEDFNDVVAFPQAGRSHEIELKIVAKSGLTKVLDEQEVQFHQQLLKLKAMQERAINNVIGAEEQWKATGKLRPEDLVELAEAEQIQKDIQARIGTKKDEGLRGELAQMEEILKDNKQPKSERTERIRTLREELERISRENLPKIEPGLTKARRELEAPDKVKPPDANDPGDLGNARAEQEKVQQTLEDLLKFMEERATFQQLKGELRAILQEQQERQKEVEKLQGETAKHGEDVLRTSELKVALRRTAELQRRLADRAQKLIDRLEQHGQTLAQTDAGLAEMLQRAAKIGTERDVPEEMKASAKLLNDNFDQQKQPGGKSKSKVPPVDKAKPNLHLAYQNQGTVIDFLQKMLEALDRSRADEVERIVINQKKEQKNLEDLAGKIAKMQNDIEAAKTITDPRKRAAQLKKLGDDLRELQKQAEQSAREMARAEANDAAKDLKDAAKRMERVLQKLERGEEPEEPLQQAQQKIEDAKEKLQQARDMAEQELSREQIAKIVDRLKGLKERQDGVLAESERLRKDFLLNARWTPSKLSSLMNLEGTQQGVAGETGFLKDKLKGAKVFHTILDRAHQDMKTAVDKSKDWQRKANQHKLKDQEVKAGKVLSTKEFAEEKALYEAAVKPQKNASDRLQRLIDALLPELDPPKQDPKKDDGKNGGKEGGGRDGGAEKKGGIQAQDGIPPVAQLKALKAEQLDVNARTREFAELHPNAKKLTRAERDELEAIHAEQDRLLQLFRELITSAKAEGERQ